MEIRLAEKLILFSIVNCFLTLYSSLVDDAECFTRHMNISSSTCATSPLKRDPLSWIDALEVNYNDVFIYVSYYLCLNIAHYMETKTKNLCHKQKTLAH